MKDSSRNHAEVRRKLVSIKHWLHIGKSKQTTLERKLYGLKVWLKWLTYWVLVRKKLKNESD
jgi:hypothetical protein